MFSEISNLPSLLLEKQVTREVLDVFDHLFEVVDASLLPERAVIKPYTNDAEGSNLRDNTPPWEETGLSDDENLTYFEVFVEEIAEINAAMSATTQDPITSALSPNVAEQLSTVLPKRMYSYSYWIVDDLNSILKKRLLHGRSPSLLEDLFQIYRAGFFSFGWTGHYPDDVKLLVFPSWEVDPAIPAPPIPREHPVASLIETASAVPRQTEKPHVYSFAEVRPDGGWDGLYATRLPLHGMRASELEVIPDTMHKRLCERPFGFKEEFHVKSSEPLTFQWKQTSSTSGIATITHDSEPLSISAILAGVSPAEDETAIEAMEVMLAKNGNRVTLGLGRLVNRPLVVSARIKNVPAAEVLSNLLTIGFADVYFLMVDAYRLHVNS